MYDPDGNIELTTDKPKGRSPWLWVALGCGGAGLCALLVVIGAVAIFFTSASEEGTFAEILQALETAEPASPTLESDADTNAGLPELSDLPGVGGGAYGTAFDDIGNWATGEVIGDDGTSVEAEGIIANGVYRLTAYEPGLYWGTAGERLGDGSYSLKATAVGGPENNGFGLLFMLDESTDDFYIFEISSDGYVWIGLCIDGCAEVDLLVGEGWFQSEAVRTGLNATNILNIQVEDGNMTFFVNETLVGEAFDTRLTSGDVGLFIEMFDEGEQVAIQFDDLVYIP